ncbi:MAG: DUF3095 domain-containing protein [Bacteroidetes bacterium]|nr:DUF3095 domain-containing protein [Bacteroidota bacterium]
MPAPLATDTFYSSLPAVDRFADLSDDSVYQPLPDDWSVAVTDVKDSTGLIRRGRYKQVNLVGASAIMAVLNLKKDFSVPFIFGGDGASLCIPASILEETRQALAATRAMAADLYGIELRTGIIPVSYIRAQGRDVLVAKSRLSSSFTQAAFTGGGLQYAEECLKDPAAARFRVEPEVAPNGDFTGLECRWQNIPSAHEEIVSLIVQAVGKDQQERNDLYRSVLAAIGRIYGDDTECHPVREEKLTMALSERFLAGESDIRSYAKGRWARVQYWFGIRWSVLLGKMLMATGYKTKFTEWGTYKQRLVRNTDFKKFDDKIRQVLSGSRRQREQLEAFLAPLHAERKLVYGLHAAPHALITCLLFNYSDAHVHLVDADDGGYAIAALRVKEQMRSFGMQ